jgi:type IV fimbrial biogenesis protein FimT
MAYVLLNEICAWQASSAVQRKTNSLRCWCQDVAYKLEGIVLTSVSAMPLGVPRHQRGFTLVELLATIAVLVILSSIAAASLSSTVNNNRLYAAQNEFVAYLALARSEAARRGVPVTLSAVSPTSGNAFGGGWNVWVDTNGKGSFDSDQPVLRSHEALPSTIMIGDGTTTSITFNPTGFLAAGAVDIKLCASDPTLASFDITIQANGLTDVADVAGHSGSPQSTCS